MVQKILDMVNTEEIPNNTCDEPCETEISDSDTSKDELLLSNSFDSSDAIIADDPAILTTRTLQIKTSRFPRTKHGKAQKTDLRFQIDIQISPK
jgi:hypothetical protein